MKKVIASILLGVLIYRILQMLEVIFLGELLNDLDSFLQIIPSLILPFFIGLLVAFIANSQKNNSWLYSIIIVIIDQFIRMITPSFVGYSLYESFMMWLITYPFIILLLVLAGIGGKCGDIIRIRKSIKKDGREK